MVGVSDLRKAYRLLHAAAATRSVARRVQRRSEPLEPGRFRIAVYFADGDARVHHVRQWYRPLLAVAEEWPVVVLARSASGAESLLADGVLPVAFVPTVSLLEGCVAEQDIRVVLYVNQNTRNFQMFRYGRRWHVFIGHGELNAVERGNQYKAYDFAFVSGRAARNRLAREVWDYDVEGGTFTIGRPQSDRGAAPVPSETDGRTAVLYAPTWEADEASPRYGSVLSHGERLVAALLASGRHRVIYRPHPRTGARDSAYRAGSGRIIAALAAANAADPAAQHVFDDDPQAEWIATADVAIVDVAELVYDRLAVGRPLLITRPADAEAAAVHEEQLSSAEWLPADAAGAVVAQIDRARSDDRAARRLREWAEYCFGDTTPGVATARFRAAIAHLMTEWERARGVDDMA